MGQAASEITDCCAQTLQPQPSLSTDPDNINELKKNIHKKKLKYGNKNRKKYKNNMDLGLKLQSIQSGSSVHHYHNSSLRPTNGIYLSMQQSVTSDTDIDEFQLETDSDSHTDDDDYDNIDHSPSTSISSNQSNQSNNNSHYKNKNGTQIIKTNDIPNHWISKTLTASPTPPSLISPSNSLCSPSVSPVTSPQYSNNKPKPKLKLTRFNNKHIKRKKYQKKYKRKYLRNKHVQSSHTHGTDRISMSLSKNTLKIELSEAELKISQEKHENNVLKKENEKLKKQFEKLRLKCLSKQISVSASVNNNHKYITSNSVSSVASTSYTTPVPTTPPMDIAITWNHSHDIYDNTPITSPSKTPNISYKSSKSTKSDIDMKEKTFSFNTDNIDVNNGNINQTSCCTQMNTNTNTNTNADDDLLVMINDNSNNTVNIHDDNNSVNSIDDLDNDYNCSGSITACIGIKRIILSLKWYNKLGNNHEKVYKKMMHNNFGESLLTDYNHIMAVHLNSNANKDIRNQYQNICNQVHKFVTKCPFKPCNGYRRYIRAKRNEFHQGHQPRTMAQNELQIYVNIMDSIHSCFMHLPQKLQNN